MTRRIPWALGLIAALSAEALAAQQPPRENPTLRAAVAAYDNLDYGSAISQARRAMRERLTESEVARAWEILGFAYASLDSTRQATDAFKQAIVLNPDQDLDPRRISPKITTLFALALGQVLVVRHLEIDSAGFVAGVGGVPVRFIVSQPARVRTRIVGQGGEVLLDSSVGQGTMVLRWNGLLSGDRAPAGGAYRVVVEAASGRDSYSASAAFQVNAGAVDTVAHLTALPGYEFLPETVVPERNWRPMGLAFLYTGVAVVGTLALEDSKLGEQTRAPLALSSAGALLAGAVTMLKRPDPVPARANIMYNQLLRDQVARRNQDIGRENEQRRRQVRLTITPQRGS